MSALGEMAQSLNRAAARLLGVRVARVPYHDPVRYHERHEREASEALSILKTKNSSELSASDQKQADEYAATVLGGREYAPWLYVYAAMAGEFKDGWIPDNFFGQKVVPNVNKGLAYVTGLKTLSARLLQSSAIPDLAYHVDGILYRKDFSIIDRESLRAIATSAGPHVFVKADRSSQGKDVVKVASQDLTSFDFRVVGDCVVQSAVEQHPFFESIISGPVATLRITTVKNALGVVELRAAFVRLGRRGSERIGDTSVCVSVIDGDGTLDACGYYHWERLATHPDTGASFAGARVPEFAKAVATCSELHSRVPHLTIVGWDTTIASDGSVKIFEWNGGHCDIKFSEATVGPCFTGLSWESLRDRAA
jgi:hypothetical protein